MLIDFVPTTNGLSLAEAPAFKKLLEEPLLMLAVGIARLGGSSAFIGKVGEDEFGYMLADILKENNVNSEGMRFDPGARTALAFVTLRSDGDLTLKVCLNHPVSGKILHYGSISLITEPCKSAHIAAAKAAKDAGVVLSYDPNLRLPLWPSAKECERRNLSIWETADVIKFSVEFFLGFGVMAVVLGVQWKSQGMKVDAVDTTGAGDAFVAGILSQLAVDLSLLQKNIVKETERNENGLQPLAKGEGGLGLQRLLEATKGYGFGLEPLHLTCPSLNGHVKYLLPKLNHNPTQNTETDLCSSPKIFRSHISGSSPKDLEEGKLRDALLFANACGALTVTERGAIPALPTREAVLNVMLKSVA
ncbi:unnamed protein product [Prunus armeniaca]|uniref:Carbohydrate kinase PfkB domain-containing protein n=1 Tax=Prunus armeniaca TaxID=36596 RepID=A0A6J5UE85_PRUAR|nr:unnamed protein product [Prunus armeniaca]